MKAFSSLFPLGLGASLGFAQPLSPSPADTRGCLRLTVFGATDLEQP